MPEGFMQYLISIVLLFTSLCIFGTNIALACDYGYDEWEPHGTGWSAEPPLYFDNNCLKQLYPLESETNPYSLLLLNECTEPVRFESGKCDGACLPFILEAGEEVALNYPGVTGLTKDGQRKQNVYYWSTQNNDGVLTMVSVYNEEPKDEMDPCGDSGCSSVVSDHSDNSSLPISLFFVGMICLGRRTLSGINS